MRREILKWIMSLGLLTGVLASGFSLVNPSMVFAANTRVFSFQVDGVNRTYTVLEPSAYSSQKEVPLIVMLHGAGGTGMGVIQETAWDRKADQEGFLVVFPDAMRPNPEADPSFLVNPQIWNDGSGRGFGFLRSVDDVKFLSLMLDQLAKTYAIDRKAVFLTGFSNGASMGFKAISELPGRFKAFAAISGHYWPPASNSVIKEPIPTIFIVGTADPLNPWDGGTISLPWGSFKQPPLISTIVTWARQNGNHQGMQTVAGRPGVKIMQGAGESRIPIRAYIVEGLGHMWPGGEPIFPEEYIGKDPGTLGATDLIWEFFIEIKGRKH